MWRCQNCGSVNPDNDDMTNVWVDDRFCPYCGASRYAVRKRRLGCAGAVIASVVLAIFIALAGGC